MSEQDNAMTAVKNYLLWAKKTHPQFYGVLVQKIREKVNPDDWANAHLDGIGDFLTSAMNTIIEQGPKIAETVLQSRVAIANNNAQVQILKAQSQAQVAQAKYGAPDSGFVGAGQRIIGYDSAGRPMYSTGIQTGGGIMPMVLLGGGILVAVLFMLRGGAPRRGR